MADVYPGLGDYLAKTDKVDWEPALDELAASILADVQAGAAEHYDTGEFAASIHVEVDRGSPSGRDRLIVSDDPAALSIEYGHYTHAADGTPLTHVPGLLVFTRAADAARHT